MVTAFSNLKPICETKAPIIEVSVQEVVELLISLLSDAMEEVRIPV